MCRWGGWGQSSLHSSTLSIASSFESKLSVASAQSAYETTAPLKDSLGLVLETQTVRIGVRVPATSGNLGPGFDALGLAYQLYDDIEVEFAAAEKPVHPNTEVIVTGEGAGAVPLDDTHLVMRAIRRTIAATQMPQPNIKLTCHNRVPHGRGLGSSAAAVVVGITAAQAYLSELADTVVKAADNNQIAVNRQKTLELATEFEGHPDNAAPAIYGGATVAWFTDNHQPQAAKLQVSPDIVPTLLMPQTTLPTKTARAALPQQVPHHDAAHNAGRSALLVTAMANQPELLFDATSDRLHQNYRAAQMPSSSSLMAGLRELGFAAVVSGAGPTLLVLSDKQQLAELDKALDRLIGCANSGENGSWRIIRPGIDANGAVARRNS